MEFFLTNQETENLAVQTESPGIPMPRPGLCIVRLPLFCKRSWTTLATV